MAQGGDITHGNGRGGETTVDFMSLRQFDWWLYNDEWFTIMRLRRSVIMRNRYTNYNIYNCGGWIPTCYRPTSFHMLTSCSHFQYPWSRLATCHTLHIYIRTNMGHGVVVVVLVIHWNPAKTKQNPKKLGNVAPLYRFYLHRRNQPKQKEIEQQLQAVRAFMVKPFEMNGNMASFIIPSPGTKREVARDSLGNHRWDLGQKNTHTRELSEEREEHLPFQVEIFQMAVWVNHLPVDCWIYSKCDIFRWASSKNIVFDAFMSQSWKKIKKGMLCKLFNQIQPPIEQLGNLLQTVCLGGLQ